MNEPTASEIEDLRNRLREAEETLFAIRNGEVDSLVVTSEDGDQVFSLNGAERPYRVFVEQMHEGALTITVDATILYCNRRFAEIVRTPLERLIGSDFLAFLGADGREELEHAFKSGATLKTRHLLRASDGTFIATQLAISQLPAVDNVHPICVVVTDLTEREEKQELATALQRLKVAQQQLQAQNEELARARADAEAANDAKDKFLAALSHELRTPLTPVLLTVAALETESSVDEQTRKDLALVRRNVELEARLIDDLLDLTRIIRGKIELRTAVVDITELLGDAIEICRSDFESKRLRIEQRFTREPRLVEGDPVRIQQVFWNIIRNAVKFTPSNGSVTVGIAQVGSMFAVTVRDTGIGIQRDALDRIFRPFEQADRVITQQFGGLGLGLAISHRLTELHGGSVHAASDGRGQGAAFTVSLPVAKHTPLGDTASDPSSQTAASPRRLKILLVEDHEDTRRSMMALLKRQHEVCGVSTVNDALRAADESRYDLVISDIGLPDGSGLDLMRRLNKAHGLTGLCLSGYGMEEDVASSAEAGFAHHLTKPVDFVELEKFIDKVAVPR